MLALGRRSSRDVSFRARELLALLHSKGFKRSLHKSLMGRERQGLVPEKVSIVQTLPMRACVIHACESLRSLACVWLKLLRWTGAKVRKRRSGAVRSPELL